MNIFRQLKGCKKYIIGNEKYGKSIGVTIGKDCEIYPEVSWGSELYLITIGDNVRLTSGVKFVTHDGGIWTLRKMGLLENADLFGPITIGNNVHVGLNVIIMPGISIGNNCIIGCGAVVTRNIPDNSVVAGVPAKIIKSTDEYYNKLKNSCDYTKNYGYGQKKNYLIKKYGR
jgi:acetyltransferase-like isoleucine patch superfamily enzyme